MNYAVREMANREVLEDLSSLVFGEKVVIDDLMDNYVEVCHCAEADLISVREEMNDFNGTSEEWTELVQKAELLTEFRRQLYLLGGI